MPITEYSYEKTPVDVDRLISEINDSEIVTAIDHINLLGNQLSIFFKAALTEDDENILDLLVENHTGEPFPAPPQLVEIDTPTDSDGSPLQRIKITNSGWHYQLHGIEFETSKLNSLISKKVDNTDYGFTTIKFYKNVNGTETEITGDDLNQTYLDSNCIKTIIDWEPTHDLEIIGGILKQSDAPSEDLRLWVVGVPDVPENYGGSKPFCVNVNLKYVGLEEGIKVDGRAPKYLAYSAQNHTNKLRLILRHSAGLKHKMHMIFELFKA